MKTLQAINELYTLVECTNPTDQLRDCDRELVQSHILAALRVFAFLQASQTVPEMLPFMIVPGVGEREEGEGERPMNIPVEVAQTHERSEYVGFAEEQEVITTMVEVKSFVPYTTEVEGKEVKVIGKIDLSKPKTAEQPTNILDLNHPTEYNATSTLIENGFTEHDGVYSKGDMHVYVDSRCPNEYIEFFYVQCDAPVKEKPCRWWVNKEIKVLTNSFDPEGEVGYEYVGKKTKSWVSGYYGIDYDVRDYR